MNISSILITGASSGIGRRLACDLSQKGINLCLLGRNTEKLKSIQKKCEEMGATAQAYSVDITDANKVSKIILEFDKEHPLDLVIANAGIGTGQSASQNDGVANSTAIIQTNILGIHNTLDPLIPLMKERQKGQIAIMSSLAGYRGFSKYYVYSATKAYARVYGQGLRLDLKKSNIKVSTITPGFVKTDLTDHNTFKMPQLMTVEQASSIIIRGLKRNKSIIAFPRFFNLMTRFIATLPTVIADKIAEKISP